MSDYEKIEADRKQKEQKKKRVEVSTREKYPTEISNKRETEEINSRKEVDYNALDYEENENQSEDEHEVPQKQVSSLVQYPIPGSFQANQQIRDNTEKKKTENESVANKRSEVLAMALGVQIKTGEDPPTGEIKISGYDKKNKRRESDTNFTNETNGTKDIYVNNLTGQSSVIKVQQNSELANDKGKAKVEARSDRNKFENEKPSHRDMNEFSGKRDRYRQMDYRGRDDYRRPRGGRFYNNYRGDRYNNRDSDRRSRRSPRRSRERRRSRSRRRSPARRSKSLIRENAVKNNEVKNEKQESEIKVEKKIETEAEKFKRRTEQIMLLKKKMELEVLEMKKKKEKEEAREKQVWF